MFEVITHPDPAAFLAHAEPWLLTKEDQHNLVLSLAHGRIASGEVEPDAFWAVIEENGAVVGCAMRTPPHKVLVTEFPLEATGHLLRALLDRYKEIPAVLGQAEAAEAVAMAWVDVRGGGWRPGMEQGVYRLDAVVWPEDVSGSLRVARSSDIDRAVRWGEGFSRDAGVQFPTARSTVQRWIDGGYLHMWEDQGVAVSNAVAHGFTPAGVRVGYVYTPSVHRKRGYASACVAALSQKMLDSGRRFCVLYTDRWNPTSNAIYRAVGYELIAEVCDYELFPEGAF